MTAPSRHVSPRQLADAIGVSESSVKRWADEGRIRLVRTAGGHRRIRLEEALRFARESRLDLVRPDLLGLDLLEPVRAGAAPLEPLGLARLLREGRAEEARSALLSAYMGGASVASLCDGPLRSALAEVGELWRTSSDGIFVEHRATAIAFFALSGLRQLLLQPPSNSTAPVAIGGAVAGDSSHVPTAMAAATLVAEGFEAVDLGPDTPAATLLQGVDRHRASLAWVSVNHLAQPRRAASELELLAAGLEERGLSGALGGAGLAALDLPPMPRLRPLGSMAELAAFARGLAHARGATTPAPREE